ncbi:SAV_915 family protein [Rhodococcus pyridinivorans]|uniref:SAV_915 family protein n=1 Tax=Rhodococcus pyridinivorans TaxID=103816 RepID=UPI0027DEEFD3|nr:SAV_915 family protein [Rhodococcus pyridinivorans]
MGENAREFPPIVYLPCEESVSSPVDAVVEVHTTQDGRTALLAYSALDRFRKCCGSRKPWVAVPYATLEALHTASPFDLVLLDIVMPDALRIEAVL